ncbi:MAG TPA: redoxin family protein [Alphaproteobacteria bacterium]|nr:redoxin family protein [Alphaproteobacteria bacterium]
MKLSHFLVPLILLAVLLAAYQHFSHAQRQQQAAAFNPSAVPPLDLLLVTDAVKEKRFNLKEMRGQKVLVNFFGSWCVPCVAELPMLQAIARRHALAIVGVAYNDNVDAVLGFFERYGNAYARVVLDVNGKTANAWGVRAVPESFLIDEQGNLLAYYPGPLTEEVWATNFARWVPPAVGN